jgi:hypothetical protein
MSDENLNYESEENEVSNEGQTPKTTKEAGQDPASRLEAAIAERFATRRPKDEEPTEASPALMPVETVPEDTESPAPLDARRRMIDEYRKRQSEQVQENGQRVICGNETCGMYDFAPILLPTRTSSLRKKWGLFAAPPIR